MSCFDLTNKLKTAKWFVQFCELAHCVNHSGNPRTLQGTRGRFSEPADVDILKSRRTIFLRNTGKEGLSNGSMKRQGEIEKRRRVKRHKKVEGEKAKRSGKK